MATRNFAWPPGKSSFQLGCPFHLLKEGGEKMKVERYLRGQGTSLAPREEGRGQKWLSHWWGPAGMPTAPGSARPCPPHWRPRAGSLRACRGRGEAPPPNGPLGCSPSDAGRRACLRNGTCLRACVFMAWVHAWCGLSVSVLVCPCAYMPVCGTWEPGPGLPLLGPGACGHTSCNSPK